MAQTTWGAYFLNVLESFYGYDVRIQRGRSYANRGRIFSFYIEKNKILAKVKGNSRSCYNVSLKFKPLFKGGRKDMLYHRFKSAYFSIYHQWRTAAKTFRAFKSF